MLLDLFGLALATIAVIIVFAVIPGVALIFAGLMFGLVVAAPIAAVGSLILLVPERTPDDPPEGEE